MEIEVKVEVFDSEKLCENEEEGCIFVQSYMLKNTGFCMVFSDKGNKLAKIKKNKNGYFLKHKQCKEAYKKAKEKNHGNL